MASGRHPLAPHSPLLPALGSSGMWATQRKVRKARMLVGGTQPPVRQDEASPSTRLTLPCWRGPRSPGRARTLHAPVYWPSHGLTESTSVLTAEGLH